MSVALPHYAQAFGLRWAADTPLPLFPAAPDDGRAPDVTIERVAGLPPRDGGKPVNSGVLFADGIRFVLDGASYDMVDGDRVAWAAPMPYEGGPPVALYSTVTALLLAWRGGVPLHGSAVEVDGRAILICGEAGAGKSTLAAALAARGGRLVSDDLSLLGPCAVGETPLLWPGRSSIRLVDPAAADPLDKRLVQPGMTDIMRPVPLTNVLLLRARPVAAGTANCVVMLRRQMFRPQWMDAMPRRADRLATILNAAQGLTIGNLPSALEMPDAAMDARIDAVLAMMA